MPLARGVGRHHRRQLSRGATGRVAIGGWARRLLGGRDHLVDRIAALLDVVRLLLAENDSGKGLEALCRNALELTSADRAILYVQRGDALVPWCELSGSRRAALGLYKFAEPIVRIAIEANQTIHSPDISADARFPGRQQVVPPGAGSVIVAPIRDDDEVYGALYLDRRTGGRPFGGEAATFVVDVAELAVLFLRRASLRIPTLDTGIVTADRRMQELLEMVDRVAASNATVLIGGETGTGKELVARAIHERSARKERPFAVLHCLALPASILESELFGHVRGAFTGAERDRPGRIATAQGGTVLFDEVAEIPLEVQAKLLRFLQFGEIQRLGSDRAEIVDVRVLAATHQDLPALVAEGRFREDLYYRLKVVELRVPPLRERPSDVELLTDTFLRRYTARGERTPRFSPPARERLRAYAWPGNVRELAHVVERACVMGHGGDLELDVLPRSIRGDSERPRSIRPSDRPSMVESLSKQSLEEMRDVAVSRAERQYLVELLERSQGNISQAARASGIHRSYLQRIMSRHGLRSDAS